VAHRRLRAQALIDGLGSRPLADSRVGDGQGTEAARGVRRDLGRALEQAQRLDRAPVAQVQLAQLHVRARVAGLELDRGLKQADSLRFVAGRSVNGRRGDRRSREGPASLTLPGGAS
jgi:hypothetical protein